MFLLSAGFYYLSSPIFSIILWPWSSLPLSPPLLSVCARPFRLKFFKKNKERERGFVYACWSLGVSAFTIETKKRICYHPSSVELSFRLAALAIPSIMFHHHWHIFPMSQSLYLYYLSHFDLLLNLEAYTMRIIHMYIRGGSILQLYNSLSV